MYAKCSVIYEGRASSTLPTGNYLIIYKPDFSLLIHGASQVSPRNYQGPGSELAINGTTIISNNKSEAITIQLDKIHWVQHPNEWSDNNIVLRRSEKELVAKIVSNPSEYLGFTPSKIIVEHRVEIGAVDIYVEHEGHHIIEVKRGKATISHCVQLLKYMPYFPMPSFAYIASPGISQKAVKYSKDKGIKWIKVEHEAT